MKNQLLHEIAVTAIVYRAPPEGAAPNQYALTQRALSKRRFPGMWTVPGGRLETTDYTALPKNSDHYWYEVIEAALNREVREELGIAICNVDYITSLATIHADGQPSLVLSFMAQPSSSGDIRVIDAGETAAVRWCTFEDALALLRSGLLIDGILEELMIVESRLGGARRSWTEARRALAGLG